MQSDSCRGRVRVLATLLAIVAVANVMADESYAPKWLPQPFGDSAQDNSKPTDEAAVSGDSSRHMAGELRRLFLSEQPSSRLPVRNPTHQPVQDPGYPSVGSLVQPAEEPAEGDAVPSISTAALIKADADLSLQKIKAVKYLATVECGCSSQSEDVRDALLAALDDCSEEVRYEAALAFCRSAGNPCTRCNGASCCSDEVMKKLCKMAQGRDRNGCWYERSGYVRAAARSALKACRRVRPRWPKVAPKPGPGPERAPGQERVPGQDVAPTPGPDDQAMDLDEPSLEDMAASAPSSDASSMWATPSPTGTTLGMVGDFLGSRSRTATIAISLSGNNADPTGPSTDGLHSTFQTSAGQHTFLTPGDYNDLTIHTDLSGDGFADLWQLTEVLAAPGSVLLNYQNGNRFPLGAGSEAWVSGNGDVTSTNFQNEVAYYGLALIQVELPPSGVRGLKIAENNSTLPRDRVFFNYSYFHNVMMHGGGALDINRFVFGFEKILDQGRTSIETRIPFASTLNSDRRTDGVDLTGVEFGNVALLLKRILCQGDRYTLGGGLAMSFPTARDSYLFRNDLYGTSNFAGPDGTVPIMRLKNEAYHLVPWLGLRLDPCERLFVESFLELDFGLNENRLYGHYDGPQGRDGVLPKMGAVYDETVLMADVSVGYWWYRDKFKNRKLTGIVPNMELHYTTALQDGDVVSQPGTGISANGQLGRFNQLNLTAATHFVFRRGGNITPAIVVPLLDGNNRQFDYEIQVQTNVPF